MAIIGSQCFNSNIEIGPKKEIVCHLPVIPPKDVLRPSQKVYGSGERPVSYNGG